MTGEGRVRFVSRPSSIPAARSWLAERLSTWGRPDGREDVLLVASELTANAMLHSGGQYFEVGVSITAATVLLVVEDQGTSPASAIAHRSAQASHPVIDVELESTTGRGLLLVSALANAWGIEEVLGGTRVWAEFSTGQTSEVPRAPRVLSDANRIEERGVRVIELLGCPPDLLLAHDSNLADTARELHLFGATHGDACTAELAGQVAEIVRVSAVYWDAARSLAHQAVQAGISEVDIATAPADWHEVPANIAILRQAVAAAEDLMASGLLITMPAPQPVQEWRDWVEAEMTEQVRHSRPPISFASWRQGRATT